MSFDINEHQRKSIAWLESEEGQASLRAWLVESGPCAYKLAFINNAGWALLSKHSGKEISGIFPVEALALVVADRTDRLAGSGVTAGSQYEDEDGDCWSAWWSGSIASGHEESGGPTQIQALDSVLRDACVKLPDAPMLKRADREGE